MTRTKSRDSMRQKEIDGRQKWGVPDWRDESAYGAYENLTRDDFRWQFLRRTPAYRSSWEAYRTDGSPAAFSADAEENYGLEVLINPAQFTTPAFAYPELVVPAWTSAGVLAGEAARFVDRAVDLGFLLTAIDPSFSLDANIERITKTYREYEKEFSVISRASRVTPSAYPEFIRLLDARAVGVKYKDIANHFESPNGPEGPHRRVVTVESLQRKYKRAVDAAAKFTGVEWKPTAKAPA